MSETEPMSVKEGGLQAPVKSAVREWTESLLIAIVLALVVRTFVVQAFKIPTGSMRPTLLEGDRILVNKFVYRFREPEHGDVMVFKFPTDKKRDFIKRLVATGGEQVEIRDGDIYIDGDLVDEPLTIKNQYYYNDGAYGAVDQATDVPEEQLFVLGDNSRSSRDSRYWGFVPRRNAVGKAFVIYWPPKRIGIVR